VHTSARQPAQSIKKSEADQERASDDRSVKSLD